jgi:hypothetical protein
MSKASESELLVEPPRYIELPRTVELWVIDSLTEILVKMEVQPFWSKGTALSGRKDKLRLSGLQGEGYRRIESAYPHTLTTATSTREGLLAARKRSAGMKPICQ